MKIGTLHSVKTHLGNQFNAKMYRIMYEDWAGDDIDWLNFYYGQNTNRAKLRGLIYNYRNYDWEWQDILSYDLIAISLNFDNYSSNFRKFVTAIINDLYANFPILNQKEVIILAGNEVFEKRGSAEKVVQTAWDTAMGILNSVNPNIEVCSWNEKIRTSEEKKAFEEVLNNQQHKSVCKYMGYQSLGTEPETARQFIRLAQVEGYEVIDVELMTTTDRFSEIKTKFENNQLLGVDKVFIGCPYISTELANYDASFKGYALQIGNNPKDKYRIINYVQQFKTFTNSEQKGEMNKMLNEAIMGTIYKVGTKGYIPKLIQKCLNEFIKYGGTEGVPLLVEDGLFGSKTKDIVELYQAASGNLDVDGIVGRDTMRSLVNYFLFLGE